jgi:hypothetical protein
MQTSSGADRRLADGISDWRSDIARGKGSYAAWPHIARSINEQYDRYGLIETDNGRLAEATRASLIHLHIIIEPGGTLHDPTLHQTRDGSHMD